ncbi:MAG: BatA domain-containing protein [Candidatus Woesearchaeota archaeon]|nr:BatA domain-containing protein [Candidatus Woesearchaeota archaeon]
MALGDFFLDPAKLLWGAIFLIPLVLLYLIRPKPVNVTVPSVMFILKDMGKSNMHRMFRTLFQDILFLIQLLVILLLALTLAKPFIEVDQESLVQQSVLIIDISASTAAGDRLDEIKDIAIEQLARKNVIITAHKNPFVLEQSGDHVLSTGDAKSIIKDLEQTEIPGDMVTALSLAEQYVGPNSKVTIVSDLILSQFENPELIEAKMKVLKGKGALIDIKTVDATGKNIGIVDAQLNSKNATLDVTIQNFNEKPEEFTLKYNDDKLALQKNTLAGRGQPGSFLSVNIPLGNGLSEITVGPKDDFPTDNTYYVSIPDQEYVKILKITNDDKAEKNRVNPALRAAGDQFTQVDVQIARPPKIPDLEHNIYIIKDVNAQFILPGVIKGIKEDIEEGAILIVFAQDNLFSIDPLVDADILPVTYKEGDAHGGRLDLQVNTSLQLMRGLSDIGQVDGGQLLRVEAAADALTYVTVPGNDGPEPVLAAKRVGSGAVIYYGIKDRKAFDIDPQSYAILWGRLVDYSLTDPLSLNIPTGQVLTSTEKIKTPWGKRNPPQLARLSGFYSVGQHTLAANLYSLHESQAALSATNTRHESAISEPATITLGDAAEAADTTEDAQVPKDLSVWMLTGALLILLFELCYIKYRGDL